MSETFHTEFDRLGSWRRSRAQQLKQLGDWLKDHDLLDGALAERLTTLDTQLRSDKVMVAFVAEYSRGKSELINAVFFADHGRRMLPASAGRTTMCPSELGYDPGQPLCLRLLPIETRLQPQPLTEWRRAPEKWTRLDLDVDDPAQMAAVLEKIAEVRRVTVAEARALGFWHDTLPQDNPPVDAIGMVEVPAWRHALINMSHPLLNQGLVILDTPGLNAIGAEPELTINLIPQAHAVVFILGADTGVTRSDLAIWREHLMTGEAGRHARMVVLNKIDTLWDALSTSEQMAAQIERQLASSAEILGLPAQQVVALSAQKGLVAKIKKDERLLQASRLMAFEQMLGQRVLEDRQNMLAAAMAGTMAGLVKDCGRTLQLRRRDLAEQLIELKGLRGKNASVIQHMRLRISAEQQEFNNSLARIQAVRSVHLKLMRDLLQLLGTRRLRSEMAPLGAAFASNGLKLGIKKAYAETFQRLHECLRTAIGMNGDIEHMLQLSVRQLNTEHGFSLEVPGRPDLSRYQQDLTLMEQNHLQYLGAGNMLRLLQGEFANRLLQTLLTRLRVVFESALGDIELWNKSVTAQMDTQMRERHRSFSRRVDAVERIQQAAGGLDERIAHIEQLDAQWHALDGQLLQLTKTMLVVPPESGLRQVA